MAKGKLKRTMLYIPGNNPAMVQNGAVYGADSILLDLEDAVAVNRKEDARVLVRNMLDFIDFGDVEVTVRINGMDTDYAIDDMEAIVPQKPDAVRIPKINTENDIKKADEIITRIEKENGIKAGSTMIHAMIETAVGVENAFSIATCSQRITALTIGAQDLTADMQVVKTDTGEEIAYARQRIVMAAKAAGIAAIDTVYADVDDEEGLIKETEMIKTIGFDGKAVINPRQIKPVHDVYMPSDDAIEKAKIIVEANIKAQKEGVGVFAINGKMVDAPVVARAERVLELAGVDAGGLK
ncbi:MAG: HpcH/HpaI aldolase/citrate lyase family protein [bacterium]|nr:HpcH/HpaI aldolase/citrate lyase family protein [bacterium]